MGFPRSDNDVRIYRDGDGSYVAVLMDESSPSQLDAIANVLTDPKTPSLGSTTLPRSYLYGWRGGRKNTPHRAEWSELPPQWQAAFAQWLGPDDGTPFDPWTLRGLWTVESWRRRPAPVVTP